jgi:glycosyltransferase involved in cell wall biosynthesis
LFVLKVDILLATYNGENYLEDQIQSILKQTYKDWRLIIHDDGSDDNTSEIIKGYSEQYKNKIVYLDDDVVAGSAKNNFFYLLGYVSSKYIMFCDQDDVWLESKIEDSMKLMCDVESNFDGPVLLHTDLIIVDSNLNVIADSMKRKQLCIYDNELEDILLRNYVTGCTVLFNKKLLDRASFPDISIMHDWWFAIETLRNGGLLRYMDEPTVLYRQHDDNQIGVKPLYKIYLHKLFTPLTSIDLLKAQFKQYNYVKPISFVSFLLKKILIELRCK